MNATFAKVPFADVLFAGDFMFWREYLPRIDAAFAGERWTVSPRARDTYGITYIRGTRNPDEVAKRGNIFSGVNSGHNAVALAHLFGAARIVLLGFDMSHGPNGEKHHHPDHPQPMGNGGRFDKWVSQFGLLARYLARNGVELVNASRRTALNNVARVELGEVLT